MMSLCTHSAARQWPRLKFSLSFRKQLRPYDLTISLRAEEFKPYEPRPFVVVSKLKATGLPLCFIVSLFSRLWLFSNHSWVRFSGFSSSILASRCSRKCGVLRPQLAVSSFAYTVMDLRSSNLPQFSIFWHKSISNYRSVADFWCVVQTPINSVNLNYILIFPGGF